MKAIIIGAPIEIEGEPAEIAALVDLVVTGKVASEHKHRWRIAELDGSATVKGSCWCGESRDFDPHLPEGKFTAGAVTPKNAQPNLAPVNVVAVAKKTRHAGGRRCRGCGELGHRIDRCPQAA